MLDDMEKSAIYKILTLTGLLVGIVFGVIKLKNEIWPSPETHAAAPAAQSAQAMPQTETPAPQAPAQRVQNQIYNDLDIFEIGKKYAGKTVEVPVIYDGIVPWLGGMASVAIPSLSKRYLFLSHYDINLPKPSAPMVSTTAIVVPIAMSDSLRALPVPARIMLKGQVKLIDVRKELGMQKKLEPDALVFEVESFQPL